MEDYADPVQVDLVDGLFLDGTAHPGEDCLVVGLVEGVGGLVYCLVKQLEGSVVVVQIKLFLPREKMNRVESQQRRGGLSESDI